MLYILTSKIHNTHMFKFKPLLSEKNLTTDYSGIHFITVNAHSEPLIGSSIVGLSRHHPRLWGLNIEGSGQVQACGTVGQPLGLTQASWGHVQCVWVVFFGSHCSNFKHS